MYYLQSINLILLVLFHLPTASALHVDKSRVQASTYYLSVFLFSDFHQLFKYQNIRFQIEKVKITLLHLHASLGKS